MSRIHSLTSRKDREQGLINKNRRPVIPVPPEQKAYQNSVGYRRLFRYGLPARRPAATSYSFFTAALILATEIKTWILSSDGMTTGVYVFVG